MATSNSFSPQYHGTDSKPNFAFVDAGNIHKEMANVLKRAKLPNEYAGKINFGRLINNGHDRVHLYHGLANEKSLPDWLDKWREQNGVVLSLGRTSKKEGRLKQEGVDVLLTTEALRCSYRGTMKSCTIYCVDGDFLPLVDELVANGTFVTVVGFSDPTQGTVAPSLRNRADRYLRIRNRSIVKAFGVEIGDPPPLKWSSAMFRKTEETHGQQATKAGRDCHEVAAG